MKLLSRIKLLIRQYQYFLIWSFVGNRIFQKLNLSHEPRCKFILVTRSRSGSNMLVKMINRIPNTLVLGEILGRSRGFMFWRKFAKAFFSAKFESIRLIGFKFFYYHPVDNERLTQRFFEYLLNEEKIKVLHLVRNDKSVLLSSAIARHSGAYIKRREKETQPANFTADIDLFRQDLIDTIAQREAFRKLFQDQEDRFFEIEYDNLIQGKENRNLERFLELPQGCLQLDTTGNQNSSKKYEIIDNLKELNKLYEEFVK